MFFYYIQALLLSFSRTHALRRLHGLSVYSTVQCVNVFRFLYKDGSFHNLVLKYVISFKKERVYYYNSNMALTRLYARRIFFEETVNSNISLH